MGTKGILLCGLGLMATLTPKLSDPDLESQYIADRVKRKFWMIRYTCVAYFALNIAWVFLPRTDMPTLVWLFYRGNGIMSSIGYFVSTFLIYRRPEQTNVYDRVIFFWAIHFLGFNSLTRGNTERLLGLEVSPEIHDQGYQLLVCSAWIAGFLAYAEIDLAYLMVIIHCGLGSWVSLGLTLDPGVAWGLFIKMSIIYYALCLFVCEQSRRAQHGNRAMWLVQKQLEQQVETERVLAQAEREGVQAKVSAAQQAAHHSFMVAVFDIFGQLEWREPSHDAEPQLCFEANPNASLNELLGQPVEGQSLEVLLGRSENEAEWRRERQRLWEYAVLEATPHSSSDAASIRIAARKIALTCADAFRNKIEVELFIRPTDMGKAIFGILVLQHAKHTSASQGSEETGQNASESLPLQPARRRLLGARSGCSSSSTHSLSIEFPHAVGEDRQFSAWVDVTAVGLPIIQCSSFSLPSRPVVVGQSFLEVLEESTRMDFCLRLQNRLNELRAISEIAGEALSSRELCQIAGIGNNSFHCLLRSIGPGGSRPVEFRAECSLDVNATLMGADMPNSASETWLALLTICKVTEHRRRRRQRIDAMLPPASAYTSSLEKQIDQL